MPQEDMIKYDKISIDVLDLSTKTKNRLKYLDIHTFKDLHAIHMMDDYEMCHHFSYPLRRRIMNSVKIWMVQNASNF